MAVEDIPVLEETHPGEVVRSSLWNRMQQKLRNSIRTHRHTRVAGDPVDDTVADDNALQITTDEIADGAITTAKIADEAIQIRDLDPVLQAAIGGAGTIPDDAIASAMVAEADGSSSQDTNTGTGIKTDHLQNGAVTGPKIATGAVGLTKLNSAIRTTLDNATARFGVVRLVAGEMVEVEHGLGKVPVGVVLGSLPILIDPVRRTPAGAVFPPQVAVSALVPEEPNGSFILQLLEEGPLVARQANVIWWAFTGIEAERR